MQAQDDLTKACTQLTQQQLQAVLLEMTGDLAKAYVLQKRLPCWMIDAPKGLLEALEKDAVRVEEARAAVEGRLRRLRSLDEFCSGHLRAYCQKKWQVTVDPKKDLFVYATYEYQKAVFPLEYERSIKLERQSLLHMALQNFSEDEARAEHYSEETRLQAGSAPMQLSRSLRMSLPRGAGSWMLAGCINSTSLKYSIWILARLMMSLTSTGRRLILVG